MLGGLEAAGYLEPEDADLLGPTVTLPQDNMALDAPADVERYFDLVEGRVSDVPEGSRRYISPDAYWDIDPDHPRTQETSHFGLTPIFWPEDALGRKRAPTRKEARAILLRLHSPPSGEFFKAVRRALGDNRLSALSPQQRLALQSWAHQQGGPNFEAYINRREGQALLNAILTRDEDEIRRLWYSPHASRKERDLSLYFNGVPPEPSPPPPAPLNAIEYVIQGGDTLSEIAAAHGVPQSEIEAANPQITEEDEIRAGATLRIPIPGLQLLLP